MAIVVKGADKLNLGQELHIIAPHAVEVLLKVSRQMDDKCSYNSVSSSDDRSKHSKVFKACCS
jgi:hypothetical protein